MDETSELRAAGGKGWSRVMAEHEVGVAAQPSHVVRSRIVWLLCWPGVEQARGQQGAFHRAAHTCVCVCVRA